jgi:hypothetical protein
MRISYQIGSSVSSGVTGILAYRTEPNLERYGSCTFPADFAVAFCYRGERRSFPVSTKRWKCESPARTASETTAAGSNSFLRTRRLGLGWPEAVESR